MRTIYIAGRVSSNRGFRFQNVRSSRRPLNWESLLSTAAASYREHFRVRYISKLLWRPNPPIQKNIRRYSAQGAAAGLSGEQII